MIDSTECTPRARGVEQRLGKRGFPRVDMRQYTDYDAPVHGHAPFPNISAIIIRESGGHFN